MKPTTGSLIPVLSGYKTSPGSEPSAAKVATPPLEIPTRSMTISAATGLDIEMLCSRSKNERCGCARICSISRSRIVLFSSGVRYIFCSAGSAFLKSWSFSICVGYSPRDGAERVFLWRVSYFDDYSFSCESGVGFKNFLSRPTALWSLTDTVFSFSWSSSAISPGERSSIYRQMMSS